MRTRTLRAGEALFMLAGMLLAAPPRVSARDDAGLPLPVVGLPCEGCEAVFDGIPDRPLTADERIAGPGEPGEPLRIEGTITDPSGRPAPGVIVYAYHTDAHGVYPRDESRRTESGRRHGRLHGWVRSDEAGRYVFRTIRPASYPDRRTPAHVHMHVIEPGCCTYYIDSIHFTDDPRLSASDRERMKDGRGGSGLVSPVRDENGVFVVRRDIVLGEGVPGHAITLPER